jgi:hypothetical protein
MHLKNSANIAALVKKTVAHFQKTKDYCIDLYKHAVIELYGPGPSWNLSYLQVKTLHDQLRGMLVEGGLLKNTANSYLKACNRVVLFGVTFDFGRAGSLLDVEKLQEKVKSYTEGTAHEKYDRAVKDILDEKRQQTTGEPAFKVRAMRDGEAVKTYIKVVEAELTKVLQQQVTIQLRINKRKPA